MQFEDVCNVTTFPLYFVVLNHKVVKDKIVFSSFFSFFVLNISMKKQFYDGFYFIWIFFIFISHFSFLIVFQLL